MFSNYGIGDFFAYKGTFASMGYTGQDYDGGGRTVYLLVSLVLLLALWIIFRKASRKTILIIIRVLAIAWVSTYVIKTTWETICDITIGPGQFNEGILPFDTCSIPMIAGFFAGFGKGRIKKMGEGWLALGTIVGGVSTLLFLKALIYYPFFSFGAFYSMFWHFAMVFLGVLLLVTNYVELNMSMVLDAFLLHMLFSLIVIPFNYIRDYDFMLYRRAGGAPLLESLADKLHEQDLDFVTTILMIATYFGLFVGITYFTKGVKALIGKIFYKKPPVQQNA